MSTLKLENIKHENSSSNNLVLDSDGSVTISGNVGIGTSTPAVNLEVAGSSAQVFFNNTDATSNGSHDFSVTALKSGTGFNNLNIGSYETRFKTGGSQAEAMRVRHDGNIHINSTTPDLVGATTSLTIGGSSFGGDGMISLQSGWGGATYGRLFASGGKLKIGNPQSSDVELYTANLTRVKIDNTGAVTKPNHPAFLAVGNAGQTSYSAGAIILIVNQQFDKNNNFNTTNGRFTAPVDGVYMFTYGFYSYESAKQFAIKVNNSDYAPSDTCGLVDAKNTGDMCNGSLVLDLSANDYVNVGYRSGNTGSVYLNHCWFGGHLIG